MNNETVNFTAVSQPFERSALRVYTTLHKVDFAYNGLNYTATVLTAAHGKVEVRVWRANTWWKWTATGVKLLRGGALRARNTAAQAAIIAAQSE